MDSERNHSPETDQATPDDKAATPGQRPAMFDRTREADDHDELLRFARKRAAIWGLAGGGIMSLILIVCAGLIYLLGTS